MPVQPASAAERGRAERSSLPGRTAAPFREVAAAPSSPSRRGRLARRMLLCADVAGLTTAFVLAQFAFGRVVPGDRVQRLSEYLLFLATLPVWVVVAKLHGLYDRDLRRAEHSTVDDLPAIFHLVTIGSWIIFAGGRVSGLMHPSLARIAALWGFAIAFVALGRAVARTMVRRRTGYRQKTIVVGAGSIGQLVARKAVQHPEYGIEVVGLVDRLPTEVRGAPARVPFIGVPEQLGTLIAEHGIERVVIAFPRLTTWETLELVEALRPHGVQIDIVPRLFDAFGPTTGIHSIEGLPLVGLSPARLTRTTRLVKRSIDVLGSFLLLLLAAPVLAAIAWRIKRDSPGPVFFRQTRLGLHAHEFTCLKFRTMYVGTSDAPHRAYIDATMTSGDAPPEPSGLFKLDRRDEITSVGRWLRRTSLDELPQLLNVLRGDMSLVGPRPSMPYERDYYAPHHFERFLIPAGLTGLWQVTARAHTSVREALDLDVAYVRGFSLGLDLRLLLKTPLTMLRAKETS